MFVLNFFHPGMLLGKAHAWRGETTKEVDCESELEKQRDTADVHDV